jgi:hypothetical protein
MPLSGVGQLSLFLFQAAGPHARRLQLFSRDDRNNSISRRVDLIQAAYDVRFRAGAGLHLKAASVNVLPRCDRKTLDGILERL